MDRLRPRQRLVFSGFTRAEVEKLEKLLMDSDQQLGKDFFQKVARSFSSSAARAGKPAVKWTEVQSWFQARKQDLPSKFASSADTSKHDSPQLESNPLNKTKESSRISEGGIFPKFAGFVYCIFASLYRNHNLQKVLLFANNFFHQKQEKRSQICQSWNLRQGHQKTGHGMMLICSSLIEFLRLGKLFVGFGAEEDEWVNVRNAVRERSIPLDHTECHKLKVGDSVCCFQERRDQAQYFDARIIDIRRKTHDIRGCRCLFLVQYDHDSTEERVRLRRICCRPT